MGNYNPHAPYIIGEEWVPIREEVTQFTPSGNVVEVGHRFQLTTTRQVTSSRMYVKPPLPVLADRGQTFMSAVYATGTEDQSGPVQRVVVPCNAVVISGGTVSGAATGVDALLTASSSTGIALTNVGTDPVVGLLLNFAVSSYPNLNGKRILGVNLLLGVSASDDIAGPDRITNTSSIFMQTSTTLNSSSNPRALFGRITDNLVIDTKKFGEINQFWTANSPNATNDRVPWTYAQLTRLDNTATKLYVAINSGTNFSTNANSFLYIFYAALEVLYCEEKRILVGATQFGTTFSGVSSGQETTLGANLILMHDLVGNLNPTLPAGDYYVTLASADVGGLNDNLAVTTSNYPDLNALRQLYAIPPHTGVEIDLPFPIDNTAVGRVFVSKEVNILPQISLHASGGTLTEPHVYGRQAAAQVYNTITATQEILDSAAGGATSFPQVRFYARRFGDTTVNLLFDSPTITGSSVTITPAEWDALDEIIDGWKAITKRFAVPPSMGAGTNPQWRWSATGETSGNRWEILGAIAPALSGVGGNLQNQVPTADRLATATYGAPSSGSTINLGWVPGYAPPVTSTTDDVSADAVLIFSQDPGTITGFAVNTTTQALTGFVDCGKAPCCLPTALSYNRVTWSPTTLPTTGFGAYDLQRFDSITAEWQTIMLATSPSVTGFNDYEARVGVLSRYQIRQTNVLDFAGLWSATGNATITEPGVTMPSCGTSKRGVLIFTTNEVQSGLSNLAYAMTWDNEVVEDFAFPEVNQLDVQTYLDRDYQVAFHGTERGGEQFQRRLLLANAAVPLPRLANMKSLRDLGWADIAYVCVRDDIGDRWFATIVVPGGEVRRNRRLYNATLSVIEVTGDASQVNP